MTKSISVTEGEIPLYLVPRVIARQICRIGDSVYRVSVKRTHWHHYNISVRTKSLPKELAPARVTRREGPGDTPGGNRQNTGNLGMGCEA
jgi:hypothetical protein